MDRHGSLVVTQIAVIAVFAAINFPIAGFLRHHLPLNRWLCLLLAMPITMAVMVLLNLLLGALISVLMRDKNSKPPGHR